MFLRQVSCETEMESVMGGMSADDSDGDNIDDYELNFNIL